MIKKVGINTLRIIYFYYLLFHRRPTHNCEVKETRRPVENVALTTKGLQERKQLVNGTTVKNRKNNKLFLTEIFPLVHETWYLKVFLSCHFRGLGVPFLSEMNQTSVTGIQLERKQVQRWNYDISLTDGLLELSLTVGYN